MYNLPEPPEWVGGGSYALCPLPEPQIPPPEPLIEIELNLTDLFSRQRQTSKGPYRKAVSCDPEAYSEYLSLTDYDRFCLPTNNYFRMLHGQPLIKVPDSDLAYHQRWAQYMQSLQNQTLPSPPNHLTTMAKKTTTAAPLLENTDVKQPVAEATNSSSVTSHDEVTVVTVAKQNPVQRTTLFGIEQQYIDLMLQIEEADGELTDELAEALKLNEEQLMRKGVNYHYIINLIDSEVDAIAREIKRLQELKKAKERRSDQLKEQLMRGLLLFGHNVGTEDKPLWKLELKHNDTIVQLSTRRSESVTIESEDDIPAEFWRRPPVPELEVDKTKISKALKEGIEVPGASLTSKFSLVIK